MREKRKRGKEPDEIAMIIGIALFTIFGIILIWKQILLLAGPAPSGICTTSVSGNASVNSDDKSFRCDKCVNILRRNGKCRFCDEDYDKCPECGRKLYFTGSHPEGECIYCGTDDYFPGMPYIPPVIE